MGTPTSSKENAEIVKLTVPPYAGIQASRCRASEGKLLAVAPAHVGERVQAACAQSEGQPLVVRSRRCQPLANARPSPSCAISYVVSSASTSEPAP